VRCSICGYEKPKFEFTASQLKRKDDRICIVCLSGHSLKVEPIQIKSEIPPTALKYDLSELSDTEHIEQWKQQVLDLKRKSKF